jgi:hypothetical protein
MPSRAPFIRPLAAAALAVYTLLLVGCGTVGTVPIGDAARAHLQVVSVNPAVRLPDEMTYMGPGQAAALMLGGPLVGSLIANSSAATPKAQLASEMQASHIALGDIVAGEFARQASDSAGPTRFVVGTAPADAQVELTVNAYGVMHAQPFGSTLYPLVNLSAVMKAPDGRVLWQATEIAGPLLPDNKQGYTFEQYSKDPELLRQVLVTGSDIASRMLADNLMGRQRSQNVPGIQQ